eukprot:3570629-Pleurochrysis_carterae.AAC.1
MGNGEWLIDNHSQCTPLQVEPEDRKNKALAKKALMLLVGRQRGFRGVRFRLDSGPVHEVMLVS